MPEQTKAQLIKVEIERYEGPTEECITVTLTSWEEAEQTLRRWAKTAPVNSADKCYVAIYFDNGDTFKEGFGLKRKHRNNAGFARFVRQELMFMTGEWRTSDITKEQHERYLKTIKPEVLAEYRKCLDTWIIPE